MSLRRVSRLISPRFFHRPEDARLTFRLLLSPLFPSIATPPVQISPITAATNQQPTVQTFDPYGEFDLLALSLHVEILADLPLFLHLDAATYLNEVDSQRAFKERGKLAITTFKAGGDDRALTDRARGIEGRANIGGGEVRFRVTSSACTHSDQVSRFFAILPRYLSLLSDLGFLISDPVSKRLLQGVAR